jgi:DNA-binding NarL/FixJ family response regulator
MEPTHSLMEPTHKNGQGPRPTCLIVEAHALARTSLREWLMGVFPGCHFLAVGSGEEAIWLANSHAPDVILMAIGLPGMSGLEATRRIKQVLPQVKVVILTLYDNMEYRAEAGAAKANAYVLKQTMSTDLVPLLKSLFPGQP